MKLFNVRLVWQRVYAKRTDRFERVVGKRKTPIPYMR